MVAQSRRKKSQHDQRMYAYAKVCAKEGGSTIPRALEFLEAIEKAQGYPMRLPDFSRKK